MTDIVAAENLRKSYWRGQQEVVAVNGVSLKIRAGEMVAIMGPSGSGKSTLLNLLGALDRPDSGEVWFEGRALSQLDDVARTLLRRERVGLVFQFFNLLPLLSALENVTAPLLLGGGPRAVAVRRAEELLERMGIAARRDHRPDELSGGEMQRVAIARALAPRPSLILADEPTGNLDSKSGAEVLDLLRAAALENGCSVVMVTHDTRAAAVTDRVLEFKDGCLQSEPEPTAPASPAV